MREWSLSPPSPSSRVAEPEPDRAGCVRAPGGPGAAGAQAGSPGGGVGASPPAGPEAAGGAGAVRVGQRPDGGSYAVEDHVSYTLSPPSWPVTRSVRRPPTVSTAVLAELRRLSRAALPLPHVRYATSAASSPQGRIGRSGSDAQSRAGTHVCMGMYLRIRSPDHARAWASQEQHTRQDIAEHLHVMHSCDVAAMPLLCTVALAALGDAVRKLSCSSAARIVLTR